MRVKKNAIALLITVLFIMAITVAIGIGLKNVNKASESVKGENFLIQTSMIIDDVLSILRDSKDLEKIDSKDTLFMFLSSASFIPLESSGIRVLIELKSARAKLNVNNFENKLINKERRDALRRYLSAYEVNYDGYIDILSDVIGGIKVDFSYNSDIFYEKPYLYRDYLLSMEHLKEVNDFYTLTYRDNSLKKINFENLFYFSKDKNSSIDVNYATPEVWELMLGCDKQRALDLSLGFGTYEQETIKDLLSPNELVELKKFKFTYFEPYIAVVVEIVQNNNSAKIKFEYDIENKKGYGFVYEI